MSPIESNASPATSETIVSIKRTNLQSRLPRLARVNTFSSVPVFKPVKVDDAPPFESVPEVRAQIEQAQEQRKTWEATPAAKWRLRGFDQHRDERSPSEWYEHLGFLEGLGPDVPDIGPANHLYGAPTSERTPANSHDARPPRAQRPSHPQLVHLRRWEDLALAEQKQALRFVATYGATMTSMRQAYGAQLDQAHAAAKRAGADRPWSRDFYSGPSDTRDLFERTAQNIRLSRAWPRDLDARVALAVAYAITSPQMKFRSGTPGHYDYPNHNAAVALVRHVVAGGTMETRPTAKDLRIKHDQNLARTWWALTQLLHEGKSVPELKQQSGNPMFWYPAAKITAFMGAWLEPDGPDAFFVSDVHAARGFLPHLGARGSRGERSQASAYMNEARAWPVHALHDYIARQVHAERGLSPNVRNARFIHRGQATQWGHEQLSERRDISEITPATCYPDNSTVAPRSSSTSRQSVGMSL